MVATLEERTASVLTVIALGNESLGTKYTVAERSYLGSFANVNYSGDCMTCNNCGSGDCNSCCGDNDD